MYEELKANEEQKTRDAMAEGIKVLARNVANLGTSMENGMDRVASSTSKAISRGVDAQMEEIQLTKISKIKNLETEILEFIMKCQKEGITLDTSRVKLDFKVYSYISLKSIVARYINLISFRALREEDKYKESQEYIQEETNKLINELPPFMKKYADYNYKHFFIDSISYALCKTSSYEIRVPKGWRQFSRNAYSITDCKGNFINLLDNDFIIDFEGAEFIPNSKKLFWTDKGYFQPFTANIKYEPIPVSFETVDYSKFFDFQIERSIFYKGSLCRYVIEYLDFNLCNEKFNAYIYTGLWDVKNYNILHIPIIEYYINYLELNRELWSEFCDNEKKKHLDDKLYTVFSDLSCEAKFRFLKEKGIVDLEQVLREVEEGKVSFYFATNKPIEDIIKQINLNLSNERKFDEKYKQYLQDTIDEYMQILRDLKLQAIGIGQSSTLNRSPAKEIQGPTKRRVYRRNSLRQQQL